MAASRLEANCTKFEATTPLDVTPSHPRIKRCNAARATAAAIKIFLDVIGQESGRVYELIGLPSTILRAADALQTLSLARSEPSACYFFLRKMKYRLPKTV